MPTVPFHQEYGPCQAVSLSSLASEAAMYFMYDVACCLQSDVDEKILFYMFVYNRQVQ